ncbi:MAG: hypothetical protein KDB50_10510 [Mycobacterium sp.]|nr:hypothetical protein [Mycobacterium sp.]
MTEHPNPQAPEHNADSGRCCESCATEVVTVSGRARSCGYEVTTPEGLDQAILTALTAAGGGPVDWLELRRTLWEEIRKLCQPNQRPWAPAQAAVVRLRRSKRIVVTKFMGTTFISLA